MVIFSQVSRIKEGNFQGQRCNAPKRASLRSTKTDVVHGHESGSFSFAFCHLLYGKVALELDAPLRAVAKSPSKMKRIMIEESDEEKTSEGHNEDKFKASPTRDGNISTLPDEPGESKRSTTSSSIFDTSGATDEVSAWSDAMARVIAKSSRGSSSARAVGSTEKPWGAGGEVGRTEDSDAAGDASHATAVDLSLDIEEDTARHGELYAAGLL